MFTDVVRELSGAARVLRDAGGATSLTLDATDRTVTKDAAGTVTSFTYDAAGRLLSAVSPASRLHLTHAGPGQVTEETVIRPSRDRPALQPLPPPRPGNRPLHHPRPPRSGTRPDPFAYVASPTAWIGLLDLLACKQNARILRRNTAAGGRGPGAGRPGRDRPPPTASTPTPTARQERR
ncbi:RHS repeat domain-containing protein [Streptomyces desertarenae]|uniref:RHS repeat domain-containing protein n=1 Tax=Streptomyces desertarenae TaxID=2666184 RepID=A0ABW4PKF3_9ACTN